jgi:N-acetylmuramoyl-L-alanine amidase
MRPAAPRFFLGLAIGWLSAGLPPVSGSDLRQAPTRPGATQSGKATPAKTPPPAQRAASKARPPATRAKQISLKTAAADLGLKLVVDRAGRKLMLADRSRRANLEVDSREIEINGLRFFLGEPITSRRGGLYVDETDYRTCLVPLLRPALIGRSPGRPKIIAIDAGHGGNDTGTENPRLGLKEKVFNLDVALRLRKLLELHGYKVVLTRDADERVENPLRAVIANRARADLFVSIHFNSLFPDTKTSGAEVFTFTRAGQRSDQSRALGEDDDAEDKASPVNRFDPWSVALANALHRSVITSLKLPDRGHKTKHLGMLRGLNCPAALVESGFLSSETEAPKIASAAYRQDIAQAIAAGIEDYAVLLDSLAKK